MARPRIRIRRALRILGFTAAGLLVAVVLMMGSLAFRPVRETVLSQALEMAGRSLPGNLAVAQARWPKPGFLEFEGVRWIAPPDTLVAADTLAVDVDLGALIDRRLHARRILARGLRVDVPAIVRAFPGGGTTPEPDRAPGGDPWFPRPGSLPGVPSIVVEDLALDASRIDLSPEWMLAGVEVAGACDLSREDGPRVRIRRLDARHLTRPLYIETDGIEVDGVAGRLRGDLQARLDSLGSAHLHLESTRELLQANLRIVPESSGARIEFAFRGHPTWNGDRLRSLDCDAELALPGTDELASWPAPVSRVAGVSPLPASTFRFQGTLELEPRFGLRGRLDSVPVGWLEEFLVAGSYDEDTARLDTLRIGLPDLRLASSALRSKQAIRGSLDLSMTGGGWVPVVSPGSTAPPELAASARITVDGIPGKPAAVSLRAAYRELSLDAALEVPLRLPAAGRIGPVTLRDLAFPDRETEVQGKSGRFEFEPGAKRLRLENLQVVGAAGRAEIQADLVDGTGPVSMQWTFPTPPTLLRRLVPAPDSTWEALGTAWRGDGPFSLRADVRLGAAPAPRIRWAGEFELPGPRTLRCLLPAGSEVDDLDALAATFEGTLGSGAEKTGWEAGVDLSPTSWIEANPLRIRGDPDGVRIDSLRIAVDGLLLELAGNRSRAGWDAAARAHLLDARMLRRFVPAIGDSDSVRVSVSALLRGQDPDIEIDLEGGARHGEFLLPEAIARMSRRHGQWDARLETTSGLRGPGFSLERVAAVYAGMENGGSFLPARAGVELIGRDFELNSRLVLEKNGGFELSADTLVIVAAGKDLTSTRPFRFRVEENGGLRFESLDLEGSLGSVEAEGALGSGATDLDIRVDLDMTGIPAPFWIRSGWWPRRVDALIRETPSTGLEARLTVDGFDVPGFEESRLELTARGDSSGLGATVRAGRPEDESLRGDVVLPGRWQTYPPAVRIEPQGLRGRVELRRFPMPWQALGIERKTISPAWISGAIGLEGDDGGPLAHAALSLTFASPGEGQPPIVFSTQAAWVTKTEQISSLPDSVAPPGGALAGRLGQLPGPVLGAVIAVARGAEPQIRGSFLARYRRDAKGRLQVDPEEGVELEVASDGIDLSDFNVLLPPPYKLSGNATLDLTAAGPARNPRVEGRVRARSAEVQLPRDGRASTSLDLSATGTLLEPKLGGRIEITKALLTIPEPSRKLHPVQGESMLWNVSRAESAGADSAAGNSAALAPTPAETTAALRFRPDYDLEVIVPSGVWLRGRNLDVELEGRLRIRQKDEQPIVVGNLEARQGTFTFLGRSFQLDRGRVQFFGDDEMNPTLDIRLQSKVSSTTVYVTMAGTAEDPELRLTSSPAMSEADIMSLLVMGKTSDDLDGDQAELVAQRAAAIAATYGAAELEKNLAGPLGVDMITLVPGGGPEGESSVVVGKYLSPRALLKYEQALDSAAGFFVTLQYTLTGDITLETIAGTWQSGAEISWSKDY